MKFNTKYEPHTRVFCDPGSRIKQLYSPRYSENGTLDLVESGTEDLYSYIQSHKESCDIHAILERFVAGDETALSHAQGFYADMSDMPKTYMEVLNSVIAGEHAFDALPVEIKQQFGNSFAVWMSEMESPDFARKMGFEKAQSSEANLTPSQQQDFISSTPVPAPVEQPSS